MSVLRAQKPDGTFGEVQMDAAGSLLVADGVRRIRVEKREAFDSWGVRREVLHITNGVIGFHPDVGYNSSWVPHNQGLTVNGSHLMAMGIEDYLPLHKSFYSASSKTVPISQMMGPFAYVRSASRKATVAFDTQYPGWIGEHGWAPIVYMDFLDAGGNPIDPAETNEDLEQLTIRFIRWLGRGTHYTGASLTNWPTGTVSVDASGHKVTAGTAFFSKDFEGAQMQVALNDAPDTENPAHWSGGAIIDRVEDKATMWLDGALPVTTTRRFRIGGWLLPQFMVETDKVLGLMVTRDVDIYDTVRDGNPTLATSATTITLDSLGSTDFFYFKGKWLWFYAGDGRGQLRKIAQVAISGADLVLTMDEPFSVTPLTSDAWQIWPEDAIIWRSHDGDAGNETTPVGMSHWNAGTIRKGANDDKVIGTGTAFANDMVGCTLEIGATNPATTTVDQISQIAQVAASSGGTYSVRLASGITDADWGAPERAYLVTSCRSLHTGTDSMVGCELEFNDVSVDPDVDEVRIWVYVAAAKGSPTLNAYVLPRFAMGGTYSFGGVGHTVATRGGFDTRPSASFPLSPQGGVSFADVNHQWTYFKMSASRFNPGTNMLVLKGAGSVSSQVSLGVYDRGIRTTDSNHKFLAWTAKLLDFGGSNYQRCVEQLVTIYRDTDKVRWEVKNPLMPDGTWNPFGQYGGPIAPARNLMMMKGINAWTKADYWDVRKIMMRDSSIEHAMPDRVTLPAQGAAPATEMEIGYGSALPDGSVGPLGAGNTEYDWNYATPSIADVAVVRNFGQDGADSQGRTSCVGAWRFANTTEGRGKGAYFDVEILNDASDGAHIDKIDMGTLGAGVLAKAQVDSIAGETLVIKTATAYSGGWGETRFEGKVVWVGSGNGQGQLALIESETNSASSEAGLGKSLTLRASDVAGWDFTPAVDDWVFIISRKEVDGVLYGNAIYDMVFYRIAERVAASNSIDLVPGKRCSTFVVDLKGMVGKF
ncbi:MAG: hypothetical protein Q7T82_18200 [Armatimonadota bacterium]|nr:hypothetical protein [Armatimonadota bacterium]